MRKFLTAILAVLAIASGLSVAWDLRQPYRAYSGNLLVVIEPGTRAPEVARRLASSGVLAHRLPFLLRYALGRSRHPLKAGEYLFNRPMTPLEVYWKLVQGDVVLHAIVIPEGSDRFDMARSFRRQFGLNTNDFLRATDQTAIIRDLDPKAPTLEGYLFPDTYRFPRGVSAPTVVETMVRRFRQVLDTDFPENLRQSPQQLHAIVTLASLVEKETPNREERPRIAGVFERRLEKELPLQCDPTVIYAARLDHRQIGRPNDPITAADLEENSPYNTYRHAGLPPGPIASPGEAAIRAALNPATGKDLYFVSNNRGGHVFARTLAEHQRNVARYRREVAEISRVASKGKISAKHPTAHKGQIGNDAARPTTKGVRHHP